MMRMLLPLVLVGLSVGAAPARAADAPNACAALSEADAVKLLGGPLGEIYKSETKPTTENGNARRTACGYFPKGYDFDKTEAPPARGILVTFDAMRSDADAKRFYEGALRMHQNLPQAAGNAKVTPVSGMGEGAYLRSSTVATAPIRVNLTFLKGSVLVDVAVWKNAASVDDIARAAAKQVLVRLP